MGRILDLIDQIADMQVEPFVAPVPGVQRPGHVLLETREGEMAFRYRVMVSETGPFYPHLVSPGWYVFCATPDRLTAAHPVDSMILPIRFLNRCPRFAVITLYQVRPAVWLVMPYNRADARQRGWQGEPREIHLVREALLPLDIVWARDSGGTLLYDCLDDCLLCGNQSAQAVARRLRDSIAGDNEVLSGISPEMLDAGQTWQFQVTAKLNVADEGIMAEDAIRRRLEFAGAEYLAHEDAWGRYRVRFTIDGDPHWVEVDPSLTVRSFGFCVAGTESRHSITSAVQVIRDAVAESHPGSDQLDDDDQPF